MQKIISLKDFLQDLDFFLTEAEKGKFFVYPTDTVYGIGGIFPTTLEKIYQIKQRPKNKKVSIIGPNLDNFQKESKEEVIKYFLKTTPLEIKVELDELVKTLIDLRKNGKGFTLIGKMKCSFFENLDDLTKKIYSDKTLGVRILNHPFQTFVNKLGQPFITTSANLSGQKVITQVSQLPQEIFEEVDWIVDGGKLGGKSSVLVFVDDDKLKVLER